MRQGVIAAAFAATGLLLAGASGAQDDLRGQYIEAEEIEEMDIVTPSGDEIGEVEEVLVDRTGGTVALVIETEGGIFDIGGRDVVLPLSQFEIVDDELVSPLTQESLEALPEWED